MGFNPGTYQLRFGAEKLREIYKHTYVLFVNREEAAYVLHTKSEDIKKLFKGLHALGPKVVVITDGPAGAYASDGVNKYFMPSYPDPKPPISRTGAGDAFSTGFSVASSMDCRCTMLCVGHRSSPCMSCNSSARRRGCFQGRRL